MEMGKMPSDLAFKYGVSVGIFIELGFLLTMAFWGFQEYNPSQGETFGFVMVALSVSIGSAVLLWALYQLRKWKPS